MTALKLPPERRKARAPFKCMQQVQPIVPIFSLNFLFLCLHFTITP